jgi:hypothetical protein
VAQLFFVEERRQVAHGSGRERPAPAEPLRDRLPKDGPDRAASWEPEDGKAAAKAAAEQRAHELRMAAEQRTADAKAAEEKEERRVRQAREDEDRALRFKAAGLIKPDGPTPAEAAAAADLAVLRAQIQWMQNAPKTPDVMESFDKAKSMLTKLGLKVGDNEDAGNALIEALGTPAATAMASAIGPGLNAVMLKLAGAGPTPAGAPAAAPTGPTQEQIEAFVQQQREAAFRAGIEQARIEQERAAQAASEGPNA